MTAFRFSLVVPISCLPPAWCLLRGLFRLLGTCPWLVSQWVFGREVETDGWIAKGFFGLPPRGENAASGGS
jgi:hypothetical protein